MSPTGSRAGKSATGKLTLAGFLLLMPLSIGAMTDLEKAEFLMHLRQVYDAEIFDYCFKEHETNVLLVAGCSAREQVRKNRLFRRAQAQLGQLSLVRAIYDECFDYYPNRSVTRIGFCVDSRLVLRDKLDNEPIEREIYRRCDEKWRKHGARSIDACTIHAATDFRRKGRLDED